MTNQILAKFWYYLQIRRKLQSSIIKKSLKNYKCSEHFPNHDLIVVLSFFYHSIFHGNKHHKAYFHLSSNQMPTWTSMLSQHRIGGISPCKTILNHTSLVINFLLICTNLKCLHPCGGRSHVLHNITNTNYTHIYFF